MSEERLDRLESLMQDLIKMVAVNNTMTKELKSDVAVLKDDIAVLKSDVAQLKTESAMLKKSQELFRDELFTGLHEWMIFAGKLGTRLLKRH